MPYDRSTIKEKLLAELQAEFSPRSKKTFALMRGFGDLVVACDLDPEIAIDAATAFIEIFSAQLPPAQRREVLEEAWTALHEVWAAPETDDPV